MGKEQSPTLQESFSGYLRELSIPRDPEIEVRTAVIPLTNLTLGIIYDPRLASGRMILILQEKNGQGPENSKKTVTINLFANKFRMTSTITNVGIDQAIEEQTDDIRQQAEPLEYEKGYEALIETFDPLDIRMNQSRLELDAPEKIPNAFVITEIQNGLRALIDLPDDPEKANQILVPFINRQFM